MGTILGRNWMKELNLCKALHSVEKDPVPSLKKEFPDIFSDGIGKIKSITGEYRLKDKAVPRYLKARNVPYALRDKVEEEIDLLVKEGVLSPVKSSEWATPIVPVLKSTGKIRLCGDYKVTVNPNLELETYNLPRMEDMLTNLEMGQTFTNIDLK